MKSFHKCVFSFSVRAKEWEAGVGGRRDQKLPEFECADDGTPHSLPPSSRVINVSTYQRINVSTYQRIMCQVQYVCARMPGRFKATAVLVM